MKFPMGIRSHSQAPFQIGIDSYLLLDPAVILHRYRPDFQIISKGNKDSYIAFDLFITG
jgi:hypothetical protein